MEKTAKTAVTTRNDTAQHMSLQNAVLDSIMQ